MSEGVLNGNISNTNDEISSSFFVNTISDINLSNVLMKNANISSNQAKGFWAELSKIFKNIQIFKFGVGETFKPGLSGPSLAQGVFASKSK